MVAYDPVEACLDAAVTAGAQRASSVADVAEQAEIVFLSLPSINEVEAVCGQLVAGARRPRVIVDMSTSDVSRTRLSPISLTQQGVQLVDAPVARMRQAAKDGTLLITVGASGEQFAELEPFLSCMGTDIVAAG